MTKVIRIHMPSVFGSAGDSAKVRKRMLSVVRWAFLLLAVSFGIWSIIRNWDDVSAALSEIVTPQILVASLLVLTALLLAAGSFSFLLTVMGYPIPVKLGQMIFLVGSLGKYIPGSVWSLAAQADLARRVGVPPRRTVTVGLLAVYWALFSAVFVGAIGLLTTNFYMDIPAWTAIVAAVAALIALSAPVLGWWTRRLSGDKELTNLSVRRIVVLAALFLGIWVLNGLATAALLGGSGRFDVVELSLITTGAFALAFALGLAVPLAPAGLGLREATLVLLLTPTVGLGAALVAATIMRLLHLVGDFALAAGWWMLCRRTLANFGKVEISPEEGDQPDD